MNKILLLTVFAFSAIIFVNGQNVLVGSKMDDASKWIYTELNNYANRDVDIEFNYELDLPKNGSGGCLKLDYYAETRLDGVNTCVYQAVSLKAGKWYKADADIRFLNIEHAEVKFGFEFIVTENQPEFGVHFDPTEKELLARRRIALDLGWYPVTVNGSINDTIPGGDWGMPDDPSTLQTDSVMFDTDFEGYFIFKSGIWWIDLAEEDMYSIEYNALIDNIVLYSGTKPGLIKSPPVIEHINNQIAKEDSITFINISSTDDNYDELSYTVSNLPIFARLIDYHNGTAGIIVSPQIGHAGSYDSLIVYVSDGELVDSAIFSLRVNKAEGSNTPPNITVVDNKVLSENDVLNVYFTSFDADDDDLHFITKNLPLFAVLTDNKDGRALIKLSPKDTDAGVYENIIVYVSDGLDSDSVTFSITVNEALSVDENLYLMDFVIYPNPTEKGQVYIHIPNYQSYSESCKLEVVSINGMVVFSKILSSKEQSVVVDNDFIQGIYYVRLINTKGVNTKKLIIK